jgi:hypothetical protein
VKANFCPKKVSSLIWEASVNLRKFPFVAYRVELLKNHLHGRETPQGLVAFLIRAAMGEAKRASNAQEGEANYKIDQGKTLPKNGLPAPLFNL